ncbi:MAG: hypothetical protein ACREQY_15600 [Candidatus Binatia bacterium]
MNPFLELRLAVEKPIVVAESFEIQRVAARGEKSPDVRLVQRPA